MNQNPKPHPHAEALAWWKSLTDQERDALVLENFPGKPTQVINTISAKIKFIFQKVKTS